MKSLISNGAPGVAAVVVLMLSGACGGGGGGGTGDSSGPDTTSATTGGPVTTMMTTGLDTTAGPPDTDGTSTTMGLDDTGTSSSSSSSGSSSSGESSSGGSSSDGESSSSGGDAFVCPPGGGGPCAAPGDCVSNACYSVGFLGGVCSECDEDADCAMGCSPGNPLTGTCAMCCDGSLGCGCQSVAACQAGLSCTVILDVPGILTTAACSECSVDADCGAAQLCSPSYDLDGFRGQFVCVAPGTKANGEGCDESGSGDAQCASGQCAPAAVMGIPLIAVCSECNEDADCAGGTCVLPEVVLVGDMIQVAPGACV